MSIDFRWTRGLYSKLYMHTRGKNGYTECPYSIQSFSIGMHAGQTVAYRGSERLGFFNSPEEAKAAAEATYLLGEQ